MMGKCPLFDGDVENLTMSMFSSQSCWMGRLKRIGKRTKIQSRSRIKKHFIIKYMDMCFIIITTFNKY